MAYTFHIEDTSKPNVKAFLEYLRTLDFVKEEQSQNSEFILTDKHLEILDSRRKDRLEGNSKSFTWEEVKEFARSRKAK